MAEEHSQTDRLKARLTGALALLIIGAVAWFWLLDADSPVDPIAQESSIPPAPDIQPFAVPEPAAPTGIAPVGSERDAPVAAVPATTVATTAAANVITPTITTAIKTPTVAHPQTEISAAQERAVATTASKPLAKVTPAAIAVPKAGKPEVAAHETFEMDSHGLPVAWVVQVGAMGTQASANKLRDQLIAKGFKAYTAIAKTADGSTVIKVYVGPKLSRERADAQKKSIDSALNMQTMVVRFSP